ncbi:MAG: hypothetical protein HY644_14795 [Acidobacteria bacterium]|nr:hypothetical protein [Acidobacteriota bacterium]
MKKPLLCIVTGLVTAGFFLHFEQSPRRLLISAHAETFPSPPIKKAEMRNHEARKVERILETVEARNANPEDPGLRRYRISESELNSYLDYLVERENVSGVDALFVKLREGSFGTYAIINVDNVSRKDRDIATRALMQTILAGKQYISADGLLRPQDGFGQYTLTSAHINDVEIPPAIVNALINTVGKKQNPPFDVTKPFKLPYNIREAEVKPGYIEIW